MVKKIAINMYRANRAAYGIPSKKTSHLVYLSIENSAANITIIAIISPPKHSRQR